MHIPDSVKLIAKYCIGKLPMVKDDKLIGIITDKNVIKAELSIAEVMSDLFTFKEGG